MSNVPTVNIDEIASGSPIVPPGRYTATLFAVEGKQSKADKPMLETSFLVTSGDHENEEIRIWYSLAVTEKNGKKYAGGLADIKRTFAAVGKPLPANFAFPLDASIAAQLFGKRLKAAVVEVVVLEEKPKVEGDKPRTRAQVVGLAKAVSTATAAPVAADLYGLDD
jgi:hypothetical protein